ncbi:peptide chain release factor N(5)-glutamine methyltransferase [Thermodesulfobacteriota bacterium]
MIKDNWTIKDLLSVTVDFLKSKKIESPRLCAELLLSCQLDTDRLKLYLEYDQPIGKIDVNGYREMIKRLINGEPIQYITGIQEFWSLEFNVNNNVLIPRPETEILVDQVLKICKNEFKEKYSKQLFLDLGTGSGAIAVSLAHELKPGDKNMWAIDISQSALDTAVENAKKHGVLDLVEFVQGDLFDPLKAHNISFDFILTNPPYVATGEYNLLPRKIRDYEPRIALDGHEDGLVYIERIIDQAPGYLKPGGWLFIEMAPHQIDRAIESISNNKKYDKHQIVKDFRDMNRVVISRRRHRDH